MSSYQKISNSKLQLPEFTYKCKEINGQWLIWDVIRKKYVALTPEEWVRQHLLHFLIDHKKYPKGLMSVEKEIRVFSRKKRYDIVIHDALGNPNVLVECKGFDIALTQDVIDQILRYNIELKVSTLIISNGLQTYYLWLENNRWQISDLIPAYEK